MQIIGRYDEVCRRSTVLENALNEDKHTLQIFKEGNILVNHAIQDTHSNIETNIVDTVNQALSLVFDDPYTVSLRISQKGFDYKVPVIDIVLKKDGVEIDKNLMQCVSGGQLVVISIIMRIAFILLNKEHRKILILDESLGALSRITNDDLVSNLERTVKVLYKLSDYFGIQMIVITHTQVGENGVEV